MVVTLPLCQGLGCHHASPGRPMMACCAGLPARRVASACHKSCAQRDTKVDSAARSAVSLQQGPLGHRQLRSKHLRRAHSAANRTRDPVAIGSAFRAAIQRVRRATWSMRSRRRQQRSQAGREQPPEQAPGRRPGKTGGCSRPGSTADDYHARLTRGTERRSCEGEEDLQPTGVQPFARPLTRSLFVLSRSTRRLCQLL